MSYTIIDHGLWQVYTPEKLPELAPPGAMFTRRVSDGVDWYDFARNPGSWAEGSVKATLLQSAIGDVAMSLVRDEHMLFPANGRLIEILGIDPDEADPHSLLKGKLCNLATGEFTDPPKPAVTKVSAAQAVTALFNRGLLPMVESIALTHPYPPVKIFFQRANDWEIGNPYVQAIALELGMDDVQLQSLFDDAAKI